MTNPLAEFERRLSPAQRRQMNKLTHPERVQHYLDSIPYCTDDIYRSPLSVLGGEKACCMEGALLAAVALHRLGYPPSVVLMVAEDDDDHVLAVYRHGRYWGSIAKSDFSGLRSRPPVYRTLHELVMSYFQAYYNEKARFTLRSYSVPLRLDRLKKTRWTVDDRDVTLISDAIDRQRTVRVISNSAAKALFRVDERTYRTDLWGSGHRSTYRYFDKIKK